MNLQIVDKFFDSMSNDDVAVLLLHEDHIDHDMATGSIMNSLDENRADMENWTNTFSDMKVEVLNHIQSSNTVVSKIKMAGVNIGDMEMPDYNMMIMMAQLRLTPE